jgi:hypothetical protein
MFVPISQIARRHIPNNHNLHGLIKVQQTQPTLPNSASVQYVCVIGRSSSTATLMTSQGRFLNREARSCVWIAQLMQLPRLEERQCAFKDGGYNALE